MNDARFGMDNHDGYAYSKPPALVRETYPEHSHPAPNYTSIHSRRENVYGNIAPPVLPPIRIPESENRTIHQSLPATHVIAQVPPKEEKVAGGVAAHLDYEMEHMIDFVAEMAQGMYDLFHSRFCLADIDMSRSVQSNSTVAPSFRKYVLQILTSTRLPSSTILLGLHYLSTRMTMLSTRGVFSSSNGHLYHMLTTALMLASKFLDDNTFQNRSWSEVSHIKVADLNHHEMEWLSDIKWDLHIDPTDPHGFAGWLKKWDMRKTTLSIQALQLSTPDPIMHMQQNHKYMPPTPVYTPSYSEPAFNFGLGDRTSPNWQWPPLRTLSPPSAAHSGPATPDWYGKHGNMGYAQNGMSYSARPLPPLNVVTSSTNQSPFYSSFPQQYTPTNWAGHGLGCACGYCSPHHDRYVMAHGYGQAQPVAG